MRPKSGNSDRSDPSSDGLALVQQTFGFELEIGSGHSDGAGVAEDNDLLSLELWPVPPVAGKVVSLDAAAVMPEEGTAVIPVREVPDVTP